MNISEEDKKNIVDGLLFSIYGVSDKAYQRRVWIEGKGPEWDDFDETSEYVLGDGRSILKKYKEFGMTKDQYHILKKFWREYEKFCDGTGPEHALPERFIDSPEWTKVTVLAQEVVKAFNYTYKYPDC